MTDIYVAFPGAVQKRIVRNFGGKRASTRGVILHVDAGNASSLQGWFNNAQASASSNLYVKLDGTIEQYVDMDSTSWTSGAASGSTVGVETQGYGEGEWTPQQASSIVRIIQWCADRYGIPIQPMRSSKAGERGVGWHRLGVPAKAGASTSLTGGQLWSSSAGKTCPGPGRILQIPSILATAAGGLVPSTPDTSEEDDMPSAAEVADAIFNRDFTKPDGKTTNLRELVRWHDNGTAQILAAVKDTVEAAVPVIVSQILNTPIQRRGEGGTGQTTLASFLAWNDDHVVRTLRAVDANDQPSGGIDAAEVTAQIADAAKVAIREALAGIEVTLATKEG